MAPKVAWIGLGNMGRGMVKNLAEKGSYQKPLTIYNRTTKRATDLQSKLGKENVAVVESIADAVKGADIVFTCVGDDLAIEQTIDTALQSDVSGKLFVDCSTIHPDSTAKLAEKVQGKAAHFVACPVFGAPAMADSGNLVCVLAGKKEDIAKAKPFCKGVMGRAEIEMNDKPPSKATLLKVIGNTFILQMTEALSEGHTLAEKSGLGVDALHEFVEIMFPGPYTAYSTRLKTGDYHTREEPLFAADLARKDAKHALNLAKASGARMRSVEVCDEHLSMVQSEMGKRGDITGIYGAVRKESGLPFANK